MSEAYGLKETKELVSFGISVGHAIDLSLEDGKIGLDDAIHFYKAVLAAGDAFKDVKMVPKELGDMDAAERSELLSYVQENFDVSNDKLEAVVEGALGLALQVYNFVELIKSDKK